MKNNFKFLISNYSKIVGIWEPMHFKLNLTQMRDNSVNVVQFTPKLNEVLLTHYNGQCVTQPGDLKWGMAKKGEKDKAACPQNEKNIGAK